VWCQNNESRRISGGVDKVCGRAERSSGSEMREGAEWRRGRGGRNRQRVEKGPISEA